MKNPYDETTSFFLSFPCCIAVPGLLVVGVEAPWRAMRHVGAPVVDSEMIRLSSHDLYEMIWHGCIVLNWFARTAVYANHVVNITSLLHFITRHETPQIITRSSKSRDAPLQCTCLIETTFTMQFVCTHLTPWPNKDGEASTSCEWWCRRSSSKVTWNERWKLWLLRLDPTRIFSWFLVHLVIISRQDGSCFLTSTCQLHSLNFV